jgi:hypothetical protein
VIFYEVRNSYWGCDYLRCHVIAESEAGAVEMAREKFMAHAGYQDYGERFIRYLHAEVMTSNTSEPFCSDVTD